VCFVKSGDKIPQKLLAEDSHATLHACPGVRSGDPVNLKPGGWRLRFCWNTFQHIDAGI